MNISLGVVIILCDHFCLDTRGFPLNVQCYNILVLESLSIALFCFSLLSVADIIYSVLHSRQALWAATWHVCSRREEARWRFMLVTHCNLSERSRVLQRNVCAIYGIVAFAQS